MNLELEFSQANGWVEQASSLSNPASCRISCARKIDFMRLFSGAMNALEVFGKMPKTTGWKPVPPGTI